MKKLVILMFSMIAFSSQAFENIQLNFDIFFNDDIAKSQIIKTEDGKKESITVENVIKFDVTPTINDDIVTINAVVYTFENGTYNKSQEPTFKVKINESATIEAGFNTVIEVTAKKI